VKRRLSTASILLGLALISVVADGMCTLSGLRPMTMAISGALPDAAADPVLVFALGALCAICRLAVLLLAPAFVVAAGLLIVGESWILTRAERRPSGRAATSSR
jgi:hypothetical protein